METPLKEYMFNFNDEDGHPTAGWNTVWAKTKRGAWKEAQKEYGRLNPNKESLCLVEKNRDRYESHLSLFH